MQSRKQLLPICSSLAAGRGTRWKWGTTKVTVRFTARHDLFTNGTSKYRCRGDTA